MRVYLLKRLGLLPVQVFAVLAFTFFLSRIARQSPAYWMAGPSASPERIASIRQDLGLDKPILVQFGAYFQQILHGNFGVSVISGRPALTDILDRLPATLELITISLLLVVLIGIPLGVITGLRSNRIAGGLTRVYGLFAGSFPDFVVALLLIFVFFTILGWAPAPISRIDLQITPPSRITGSYVIDSLLTGNWSALGSSLSHLVLPVLALLIVYTGGVLKIARTSVTEIRTSEMVFFARACGLSSRTVSSYVLRNALPSIITIVGLTYSFLIGAAVLVERVFGWGGVGQYSVQAITFSDYAALQLFVIVATVFSLFVFLAVDVLLAIVDPRIRF